MLNLMPKSPSGPPGLWLADSTTPPTAPLADHAGGGRRREKAAAAHQHPAEAVGGGHLDRGLHHLPVEEAPVAADHQGRAVAVLHRVEDRLDEVLHVALLAEDRHLLAQPDVPGFWSR
jgi:hypothetical protein